MALSGIGDIAASLGRIALVVAFGSVLMVGRGMLLRSTAGTLTAFFLLLFALVVALGNTSVRWLITISAHGQRSAAAPPNEIPGQRPTQRAARTDLT